MSFKRRPLTCFVFCLALVFLGAALAQAAYDPVVVELHYQRGVKFYKRGLYEKSREELERTLRFDPAHTGAREFLEKLNQAESKNRSVDARRSKSAKMKALYAKAKNLYRQRQYEEAMGVFDEILTLKPVDDFASFYKERCEILLSKERARQKKLEEKERRGRERKAAREEALRAKAERKTLFAKRAVIKDERRQVREERLRGRRKRISELREERLKEKDALKEAKQRKKEEAREEKKEVRQLKALEKVEREQAKKTRVADRRRQKAIEREQVREDKEERRQTGKARAVEQRRQKAEKKERAKKAQKERRRTKELYQEGARHYSRKEYAKAVDSFEAVLAREEEGVKKYTRAAGRLLKKAKKKLGIL